MKNALDIFRPAKDEPLDCILLNTGGGAISGLMGKSEAEAYGAKVVAGRIPHLTGTIEAYVCRVTPLSRLRDKTIADVDVERIEENK